jgi:hypothetical protein
MARAVGRHVSTLKRKAGQPAEQPEQSEGGGAGWTAPEQDD